MSLLLTTLLQDPSLRRTYLCLMCVVITSATNGYDGSMVNGLQSLEPWQDYFHHPKGSLLGLFACIMSIGSLVALPCVPYIADNLGRRWGIIIGCLIMVFGVIVSISQLSMAKLHLADSATASIHLNQLPHVHRSPLLPRIWHCHCTRSLAPSPH